MGQKLTKQDVRDAVQHAFEQTKAVSGGKNADYIPYLANVPSDLFGIAVCLPDGEIIAAGDTEYKFGIESVSKVPTAILTMNQYSPEEVLTKIGADATGLPFNSIMAILLEKDHPSTPLVNAGAIAACSMIKPIGKPDAKWEAIQGFIEGLCGSSVEVIDELYKSETATNFNNKSIAWLLKNYSRIYDDPDMALDLYTRQCSIGVTARQLAGAGAAPPPAGCSRLRQRLCGETSAGECAPGGHTRPSKRRGEYLSVCFGSEGYEACRYSCRLYRDRNSGEACYLHDFPATVQLHPVGCLRLCGGHYQYPPSFQ